MKAQTESMADGAGDGTVAPAEDHGFLEEAQRLMTLSRQFDQRAMSLQRQGRFGTFSPVMGQEASVVGSALALSPDRDWVVPQYRELPAMMRQGYPLENFILYIRGHPQGGAVPDGVNMLPIQIAIAAQLPHAAGLAWGLRSRGSDGVVLAYFGDGASSEGDFHEACVLAGAVKAPVIFFLQNNGWAISTSRAQQSAAKTLASRAEGYGFPGHVIDGNDLAAVHRTTLEAVARARAGEGPTLIESQTYRLGPHNTADDPSKYVDPQELENRKTHDPVERLRERISSLDDWTGPTPDEAVAEADQLIESALARADAVDPPGTDELFAHVYAQSSTRLRGQQEWYR